METLFILLELLLTDVLFGVEKDSTNTRLQITQQSMHDILNIFPQDMLVSMSW
jgi:hypothetical protein